MKAWTISLSSLASFILGIALMVHGDAIDQAGLQGAGWMAWGVLFVLIPVLTGIVAVVVWLGREISKDIRKERAWKQTLSPQQRTAVQVVETAALFAAWGVVHESVVKGREREAARVDQRQGDRARQAVQQRYIRPRQQ